MPSRTTTTRCCAASRTRSASTIWASPASPASSASARTSTTAERAVRASWRAALYAVPGITHAPSELQEGTPSDRRGNRRTLLAVPAEVEPAELAQLLDFAERSHTENWSLRAALVRYAQPQPQRVNDLLELVRRIQGALGAQSRILQRDGEEIWDALEHNTT